MQAEKCLKLLQSEIHSAIVATVGADGKPYTCVIDVMLADENGRYFLTAKGKAFYERLTARPDVSISGFAGENTARGRRSTAMWSARGASGASYASPSARRNALTQAAFPP